MIIRFVKMVFVPEKVNNFLEVFEAAKNKIAAREGCQKVELLRDTANSNVFFTHSIWATENDLENYRNSELFKTTWAKTKILFSKKPEAWSLKHIA